MIPAELYLTIFLYTVIILTFLTLSGVGQSYRQIERGNRNVFVTVVISVLCAVWIGFRPVSGFYFGDMSTYAYMYSMMQQGIEPPADGEWVWNRFMYICAQYMDVSDFFTIVALAYFGFTLWTCKRLTPNNVLLSMLICMGAFSFFTYCTNGIRNGTACSLMLLAVSYMTKKTSDKIVAALIAFVAFNIHHSTGLPILMGFISYYFIKSFKWAYVFWLLSIAISLVAGETVTSFFASLGFDDRLNYLTIEADAGTFSHTGFRWDFLAYSMMPIVLGYYIIYRRGIRNSTYEFLLNTYTLSNAFWVMVIRASYSNRFAYLSWFLYPIVLAYPLLKIDVWHDRQGKALKAVTLAHVGFTWFMQTFYWS